MFELEYDKWYAARQRILEQHDQLAKTWNIPLDKMCLGGSAAMVMMEIRNEAQDINMWVDSPHFERLAEAHGVLIHPMRDVVVHVKDTDIYVRKRNRYFKNITMADGVNVFDVLTLMIQKRGSYMDPDRPAEKKKTDFRDIIILNDIHAERNRVAS
jgi:hypothetical protein